MVPVNASFIRQALAPLALLIALAASVHAQSPAPQPPQRPAYDNSGAPDVARQIHVDGDCRILPDPMHPLPGHNKPKPFRDTAICYLEGPHDSEHGEERIDGSQLLRFDVHISEQTFVLQNITSDHIVFVVERQVPKGWVVDSDPQPNRYEGDAAVFPVHAGPGETVRLHVGIRYAKPLKPKYIGTN